MRAAVVGGLLAMLVCACKSEVPTECNAAVTATATCAEACAHLISIECHTAVDEMECTTQCAESIVATTMSQRVLACYVAAADCEAVDACSQTCGPGGGPVPFYFDGGVDSGESELDANVEADAGFEDAGSDDAAM